VLTTLLIYVVARKRWGWGRATAGFVAGLFLAVDLTFFSANLLKVFQGGWLTLVVGLLVFILMTTWNEGRALVRRELWKTMPPLRQYLTDVLARHPVRVPGSAVFLSPSRDITPPAFVKNFAHNKVLHEQVIFLTVMTERLPAIPPQQQIRLEALHGDIHHLTLRHGFLQQPDLPRALALCAGSGLTVRPEETTFFLSRITSLATPKPGMALWREHLFVFLARNSRLASSFFHIPSEHVVEIGVVVDI